MKKTKKHNLTTSNPIMINIILLLSLIVSVFDTYVINMCLAGYLQININTFTCFITFLPTMILGGLFVKFEDKKQALFGVLPIPIILVICMLISAFTNCFETYHVLSIPYDFFRYAFFHPEDDSIEYWRSMLIPQILTIVAVTLTFVIVPSIKRLKNKN